MTPPKKLVLVNKLETYLKNFNLKSGIEVEKGNFPDKEWLILAISTLSQGKDEIFEPNYVPTRDVFGLRPSLNENQAANLPQHLLGFGKGRHLKLGGVTKEEKVAHQLKVSDQRVQKQLEAQERLKKELELHKAKDKAAMHKLQEREKLKLEVVAEYQASAQNYVAEEIAKAKFQMQQELEREVQQQRAFPLQSNQIRAPHFAPFGVPGGNPKAAAAFQEQRFNDNELVNLSEMQSVVD